MEETYILAKCHFPKHTDCRNCTIRNCTAEGQAVTAPKAQVSEYADLANAIVWQAAKDYIEAGRFLRRHPENAAAKKVHSETADFFGSPWFTLLTDIDDRYLIGRLERMIYA